jgi:S-adenosylmethionine synthetase
MDRLVDSAIEPIDETAEAVERKGLGHPDTICDALAESFSRALSRE